MRKALFVSACLVIICGATAGALDVGPVALGFHLIPSIEEKEGRREWDLSMSLKVTLDFTAADSLEITAIMDSIPSALGATVAYQRDVTDHVKLGAGVTVLWPITGDEELRTPLFESFARAATYDDVGGGLAVEASASLPFLTVAKMTDRWTLIPLAELPSLGLAGDIRLADHGSLRLLLTLQPVIMDTTALVEPFGRVTDDLLVLPMLSAFTVYIP
jgi:hypothetical protein